MAKKKEAPTVTEVIQGLSQAAANAHDGALNEDGEQRKIGLRREEGNPLLDKRTMDGFNVRFSGNQMILSYQSEIKLREVHNKGFEGEVEQTMSDIVSYLKKECRKITGKTASLKLEGETDVRVESISRIRTWVCATQTYIIEGSSAEALAQPSKDRLEPSWKAFVEQGGWQGKRPKNDTRKKGSEVEK